MSWLSSIAAWFTRLHAWVRYTIIAGTGVGLTLLIGFLWIVSGPGPMDFAPGKRVSLADYHAADPTGVPASLASASLVQRGEYLTRAADCQACHTAKGGAPFAGGLAFKLSIGTIYSLNITPDKDTGIGNWSDAAFLNALRKGVDDEGVPLYPVMPYAAYTNLTDADALAIKAYLFSLPPVHNEVPATAMDFPYNQRWLMGVWSMLFNSGKRFEPNTGQSAQWNRGAYLVEVLGHCGECHTPRNMLDALDHRNKFAGETQAGWRAYNITGDKASGVGAWSDTELAAYLGSGHADGHGTAAGPMGDAVDISLSHLTTDDIAAMVAYLRTVPAMTASDLPAVKATAASASHRDGDPIGVDPRGKAIFAGACASCHDWSGASPLTPFATLTGARAVNDPTGINVAQIILHGERHQTPQGRVFMPAFGKAYSDAEIAAVANYVTARFGAAPSRVTPDVVAALREQ